MPAVDPLTRAVFPTSCKSMATSPEPQRGWFLRFAGSLRGCKRMQKEGRTPERAARLHVHLFEARAWNGAHQQHDPDPEPGHVGNIAPPVNRFQYAAGDLVRRGKERVVRHMRGHWCGYEARFDGQHLHAIAVDAVAQSFEKDVERSFGSAVDIIALAATVAGH